MFVGRCLWAVADGLGGHPGGDAASAVAIRALAEYDQPAEDPGALPAALGQAITAAAEAVRQAAGAELWLHNASTTLTAMMRAGDRVAIGHIGDSRAYLLRSGRLRQLTTDHVVNDPFWGPVITRCLGGAAEGAPNLESIRCGPVTAGCFAATGCAA